MSDTKYGRAERVRYEELPPVPLAFAEFLLGTVDMGYEERGHGMITYGGQTDMLENAKGFYEDFEASFEQLTEALHWIEKMPRESFDMVLDISEFRSDKGEDRTGQRPPRFGVASRVNDDGRETLSTRVPFKLAQYILWMRYPGEERTEGEFDFTRNVNLDEYPLVFATNEGDIADAKAWLETMPDEDFRMHMDIRGAVREKARRYEGVWVTHEYIDCDCAEDYIKPSPPADTIKTGLEVMCVSCGAVWDDCPNSRVNEVMAAGLPFDEHRVEYAGK